jgi:hypothetical protein
MESAGKVSKGMPTATKGRLFFILLKLNDKV